MKRLRQPEFPDEEPLSKRINNLHLDNPQGLPSSSPNSSPEQIDPMTEPNPLALAASFAYDSFNNNNNNNDFVKDAHLLDQLSHLPLQPDVMQTYHSLQKMIQERDFPESLSPDYPHHNPTSNHYYYNFNRMLHTLHLERLRRQGKI